MSLNTRKVLELKVDQPMVGAFLEDWTSRYEERRFNFSDLKDREDFCKGLEEMAKHISHVSPSATLGLVLGGPNNKILGVKHLIVNVKVD